ncbi:NagB/RpiA/CoA transferase-like superfamily protein [Actinidia rufa]|uniref:Translation initiation factor eIF2B subunit alpha n=1 Tax=Actinidia rufa TaxID=165716 RepID=A0A7J0FGD9_9ERIC|nr:NagB/RpiA/CoA transferase-like superfamily protein [Actinidia rufa]
MAETFPNPNPKISAYYQTRAAHHAVVTGDWLAQAQAAIGRHPDDLLPPSADSGKPFSVIDEFNNWRKQPNLSKAVAAIRALASVIRSSEATTAMELEMELKKASDSLKSWDTTSISLTSGCDLFLFYVTRTSALEYEEFNLAKSRLIERAEKFGEISCKFARLCPLDQKDMAPALRPIPSSVPIPSKVEVETCAWDYTPPQYLTLLFTDLGVLTPSVVSDELIQLYL